MSNLRNTQDPARMMTWNGHSLKNCSQKELIACIVHLAQQVALADQKIEVAKQTIVDLQNRLEFFEGDKNDAELSQV